MAKLYFKYGAMGSSKTANALITKFNYEERGMKVWLIKPSVDDRDGANAVKSRIGLYAEAYVVTPDKDLMTEYKNHNDMELMRHQLKAFCCRTVYQITRYKSLIWKTKGFISNYQELRYRLDCLTDETKDFLENQAHLVLSFYTKEANKGNKTLV